MTPYSALTIQVINGKIGPHGVISVWLGEDVDSSCSASKSFYLDDLGDWDSALQFASVCFLACADQLSEEGWQVVHSPECTEPQAGVADA